MTEMELASISVAVLFVRRDSVYKSMPGVDAYDIDRGARTFPGPGPIIAHPPCRSWGSMRHWAKGSLEEHRLAPWAVEQVRRWGGVLEHPAASSLWRACALPRPGQGPDAYGGFSLDVEQHWWGHRATKRTWLYVCGCRRGQVPRRPLVMTHATHVVKRDSRNRPNRKRLLPHVTHREREATPGPFAEWLLELARRCGPRAEGAPQ